MENHHHLALLLSSAILSLVLHQNQLVPRNDALLASSYALPPYPLLLAVRIIGQLPFASAADLHDVPKLNILSTGKEEEMGGGKVSL